VTAHRAYRGRFAPSPTGDLHFGSLVAAVASWLDARAAGGTWIVRIEDVDRAREVPGAAERILATLAAFGMDSDEPVIRQRDRADAYRDALAKLDCSGRLFACTCSRAALAARGDGLHHGVCSTHAPLAWRGALRVLAPTGDIGFVDRALGDYRQDLAREVGDYVVWRVEGWAAYHLAVVVDDGAQGITDIVRGADLVDSTPRQLHLQQLLGLPRPGYLHVPVVVDESGRKLSKSDRARPVDASDPLPALHAALAFLGLPGLGAGDVTTVLASAIPAWAERHPRGVVAPPVLGGSADNDPTFVDPA
jgi:glutamyl-Q tRNA(Asp) synthetase